MSARPIPEVGPFGPIRLPPHASTVLRSGLRVLAVRKPELPRVVLRLRIPAREAREPSGGYARLAARILLTRTAIRDDVTLAQDLQRLGANLEGSVDADDLHVRGDVLAEHMSDLLRLLAEMILTSTFRPREVAAARHRLAEELSILARQPAWIASERLRVRLFGRHPYGRPSPAPERVLRLEPAGLEAFWNRNMGPQGAALILVGDLYPEEAIEAAAHAFSAWRGALELPEPAATDWPAERPLLLVDRPGSVQTTIALGAPGLGRDHEDFATLALAVTVFGGYPASRLTRNIRDNKGYTYRSDARVEHRRAASVIEVRADVGTRVTTPALLEIRHELRRMAGLAVPPDELDRARRYLIGVTMLQTESQDGLATVLDAYLSAGVELEALQTLPERLQAVTAEEVCEQGARHLAPRRFQMILVGDAEQILPCLERLMPVEIAGEAPGSRGAG